MLLLSLQTWINIGINIHVIISVGHHTIQLLFSKKVLL